MNFFFHQLIPNKLGGFYIQKLLFRRKGRTFKY